MMDEFMKLLREKAHKQGGAKHDSKMEAKASMAKHLSDMLGEDLHDGIKDSMQKVTVASDSKEGLEKGLKKAEDILSKKHESSEDIESESEEGEESMSEKALKQHEAQEEESGDAESADELETEIAKLERELEEKKKELHAKR